MKTTTQNSCKMSREETFQGEIYTWLWFSNLPKSRGQKTDTRVKSKSILKNYFILYLLRKKKIKKNINKDESGIKNTGIFLFPL